MTEHGKGSLGTQQWLLPGGSCPRGQHALCSTVLGEGVSTAASIQSHWPLVSAACGPLVQVLQILVSLLSQNPLEVCATAGHFLVMGCHATVT